MTFVAVSTLGLLIPLSAMSAGLGVLVDRSAAPTATSAAPVRRPLLVVGNLAVSVVLSALQVGVARRRLGPAGRRVRRLGASGWPGSSGPRPASRWRCTAWPRCWPTGCPPRRTSRGAAGHLHRAVVRVGLAVPHLGAARGPHRDRQGPADHPRAGAAALRAGRPSSGLHDIWGMSTRPRWPGRASPSWRPSPWS